MKYKLIPILFLVFILAIPSISALQYIDSNINVSKKDIPKLDRAYNSLPDGDYKTLIGKIRDLARIRLVTTNDIKNIIEDNDIEVASIYFCRQIATGYDSNWGYFCPGSAGWHLIRPFYWGSPIPFNCDSALWPGIPMKMWIGPDFYQTPVSGFIVSYFGGATNVWTFDMTYGYRCRFAMGGIGFMILVN